MRRNLLSGFLYLCLAIQSFAGFGYYSAYNVASGQVPSTQSNFPVLVLVTDNRLKTVGNGGHVQDSQGRDIRPYTDSTLSTAITGYEKVFYDGTAGTLEMWVKVSSLTSSSTPFVLAYGDSSISTDGSSSTTWSNSFLGVYHLKDGTTLSVSDSTGSNNGTNHSVTATTGQIDGAGGFASASSQYIDCGTAMNTVAMTYSGWVKATSFPNSYNMPFGRDNGAQYFALLVKSNGKLACFASNSGANYDGTGTNTLSSGTWYYLSMTYDNVSGTITGYVNAGVDKAVTGAGGGLATNAARTDIGQDAGNAGRFWNGTIDEVRVSSVSRSANWITTEYNNQSAPGTFASLGTEQALTTSTGNFFLLFP